MPRSPPSRPGCSSASPARWIVGLLLPAIVLLVIGVIFAPHAPDPALGGQRFIDLFAPSMVVISLATLGINTLPARLVKYRELGVLRRLSTTPVEPGGAAGRPAR